MNITHLGDPKDELKQLILGQLLNNPPLLHDLGVLPMFTGAWDGARLTQYSRYVPGEILNPTVLLASNRNPEFPNRQRPAHFALGLGGNAHRDLFLDPDNGILDPGCNPTIKHVLPQDIANL